MILIADSGSTKTSWCFINSTGQRQYFSGSGINPFFRSTEEIRDDLSETLKDLIHLNVNQICFYGAGIINQEKGNVVKLALHSLFPLAISEVESDLLATARATLGKEKGIACILGTGSNSCYFDGLEIIQHVKPLGYILGDEGSGAVLGRKLISDYLKGTMPSAVAAKFAQLYPFAYSDFMDGVYRKEKPNKFLAGFVPFLSANLGVVYCQTLVETAFEKFILRNVSQYPDFSSIPVCFTGSVAFYFEEQLRKVCNNFQIKIKSVVKEPLEGLIKYHIAQL